MMSNPVHTPEEGLREFFGPEWESLRPLYAKRIPLDASLPSKLVPWSEISDQVCSRMRVSDGDLEMMRSQHAPVSPLTAEVLRNRYQVEEATINDQDLLEIETQLQDSRSQLEGILERFRRVIDFRLSLKCAGGDFDYMPYADVRNARVLKKTVYLSSFSISDWVITYGVSADEDPELPSLVKGLKSCGNDARDVILKYFADRK